jgi:hypothetical protein
VQVAAKRVAARIPGVLAVGDAVIELGAERTTDGGSHSKRFGAVWTKGTSQGAATIDIRPASKTSTQITVHLERPKGVQGLVWPRTALRRLGGLFAAAVGYEVDTRSIEEATTFGVRRTSPELVRARAS